jgi:hypothetical protein
MLLRLQKIIIAGRISMSINRAKGIFRLLPILFILALFVGCGGGGGGGSSSKTDAGDEESGDFSGDCEQVTSGNSYVKVINSSSSMIEVYLPDMAFGADIGPGECNLIGVQLPGSYSSFATTAEISQCTESPDGGCDEGGTFGNTKTVSFTFQKDKVYTIKVGNSFFN